MGNSKLLALLSVCKRDCTPDDFAGKRVGVDGFGWIHAALSAQAVPYVVEGKDVGIKNIFIGSVA